MSKSTYGLMKTKVKKVATSYEIRFCSDKTLGEQLPVILKIGVLNSPTTTLKLYA